MTLVIKFWGRPQPRPLSSYVARALIPRVVVFAALASAVLVGQVMAVDPLAAPVDPLPSVHHGWSVSDAVANPDCIAASAWHQGDVAGTVIVYGAGDAHGVRMRFDDAWRRNHDPSEADDVWVVGVCR
jgi:hypothetical protein